MQNPIRKLRQTYIISEKPGFIGKIENFDELQLS